MESEKVKEIKKLIDCDKKQNEIGGIIVVNRRFLMEVLNLINELEVLCNKTYEDLTKEIDRLESENETKTNTIADLLKKQEFYETEKLKQFAERLKEKLKEKVNADNVDVFVECARLSDETLKEFINKGDKENG